MDVPSKKSITVDNIDEVPLVVAIRKVICQWFMPVRMGLERETIPQDLGHEIACDICVQLRDRFKASEVMPANLPLATPELNKNYIAAAWVWAVDAQQARDHFAKTGVRNFVVVEACDETGGYYAMVA